MNELANTVNSWLSSGGSIILKLLIPAFFGFLVWGIRRIYSNQEKFNVETREKLAKNEKLNVSLALAQLNSLYEKCKIKGYVSIPERDIFIHVYNDYKSAGGNGVAEIVYEQFIELFKETDGISKEEMIRLENRNKIEIIEEVNKIVGSKLETMCEDMKACLLPVTEQTTEQNDDE